MKPINFHAKWTFPTTVGLAGGLVVGILLGMPVGDIANAMIATAFVTCVVGSVLGGGMQAMGLRKMVRRPLWWIAATTIGTGIVFGHWTRQNDSNIHQKYNGGVKSGESSGGRVLPGASTIFWHTIALSPPVETFPANGQIRFEYEYRDESGRQALPTVDIVDFTVSRGDGGSYMSRWG